MGLLDDAIREHLELKRLKGADPGDVAREEREALGKDPSSSLARPNGQDDDREAYDEAISRSQSEEQAAIEEAGSPSQAAAVQETIELDMESVLASSPRSKPRPAGVESDAAAIEQAPDPEESLEWEVPREGHDDQDSVDGPSEDEPIEDVLEKTPDFLRETPEQDRLWFEQRPPRDFDFNE